VPSVRILPDQIANKIAAGEVVERPASVVKELMENALDAGASSVRLEVSDGGRTRIRCTDDGCGMLRDDALLALERHATSKLRDMESLSSIATLGFRGEALPAIASVSHLELETAPREPGASIGEGTRVLVHAGKLKAVSAAGLPPGTSITVSNLFVNIPARKKFLKSEATELGHIVTLVTHYALAYPEVHFHLETPHRVLLAAPPVEGHAERLQQVLGEQLMGQCVAFQELAEWAPEAAPEGAMEAESGESGLGLFGFASRPEVHKLNRNSTFIFVNRRLVRDRLLQHAISSAYYNLLPNGMFPAVLLFLDLPFGEVDVNVHPSNTEVRFRRQTFVHDAVRDTIRDALSGARPVPSFLRERRARASASPLWARPASPDQAPAPHRPRTASEFHLRELAPPPQAQRLPLAEVPERAPVASLAAPGFVPETGQGCGLRELASAADPQADELALLRALGQVRESFIVAAGPSGLWLVDQHCAHERVLFEQIQAQRLHHAVESQRLLMPLIVELDPGRALAFNEIATELAATGFESEPFGRSTCAIHAAPAGVAAEQIERLLQEILQVAVLQDRGLTIEAVRTRIAATIACHAAVKVNMRLEPVKMEWLLGRLAETQYPMTCPHGRPVLLRYSIEEIQRAFKRIH